MRELISKQDAIRLVHNVLYEMRVDAAAINIEKPMSKEDKLLLKINQVVCTNLKNMPSAEPKRGKWIDDGQHSALFPFHDWRCSKCNEIVIEIDVPWFKFCPNCGADMRGDEDE